MDINQVSSVLYENQTAPAPPPQTQKDASPENTVSKLIAARDQVARKTSKSQSDFEEIVSKCEKIGKKIDGKIPDGLFNLYKDKESGKVFMEIKPEQLDKIFLCSVTRTATNDGESFEAPAMLSSFPFCFKKIGGKIQFIAKNLNIRAENDKNLQQLAQDTCSDSIKGTAKILAKNQSNGNLLIDASDFFYLEDLLPQDKYVLNSNDSYFTGNIKSFEKNTEIEVGLNFLNKKTTDNFFHRYNFSLFELPDKNYKPRLADDRIGLFTTDYKDYSDLKKDSFDVNYINRWRLKKQNPSAPVSPTKKPIVFWIANTIPKEYRNAVKEGILLWNHAFEKAGFKDAIIVEEQPDNADWDSSDINYNTVRLNISPEGGAIGPSHANPRTGEICAADVTISADMINNRYSEADKLEVLEILKTTQEKEKYVQDFLKCLAAHEVGHTLGVRHNFKGSTFFDKDGNLGSIMDYFPSNIASDGKKQGDFWPKDLGSYDYRAIKYAYTPINAETLEQEKDILNKKIASEFPDIPYGTDEDGNTQLSFIRDPLCNLWDLGSDPIKFYEEEMLRSKNLLKKLVPYFKTKSGMSYEKLRKIFFSALGSYVSAANNVCKYIGGVYHQNGNINDFGTNAPLTPVPPEKQREALNFLIENFFSKSAFYLSPELLNNLISKKEFFQSDFEIHKGILSIQRNVLLNLYSAKQKIEIGPLEITGPGTLIHILDNQKRSEDKYFTMSELFSTLRKAIWSELEKGESIGSFRRNLQMVHLEKLIKLATKPDEGTPGDAVALAREDLDTIKNKIEKVLSKNKLDDMTRIHLKDMKAQIEDTLESKREK